jgi:hypothetical protein
VKHALSVLVATLIVSASAIAVAGTGSSDPPSRLGVFRGSGQPGQVGGYEDWLGTSVGYAVDFVGGMPVGSDDPWAKIDDPGWWCRQWASQPWRLVLSTAMLPNTDFTLADGARGAYDNHWRNFGQRLVSAGCPDAIVRLGWEFNGRFYPWAAGGKEAQFAAYWRRIVNVLRSVDGEQFLFDWCPLAGNTNADVAAAYPGDAYVDIIGIDSYDTSKVSASNPSARWSDTVNRPYGLAWQVDFAKAHGKRMSLPEWGISERASDDLGGGDNPYYIARMWEWFNAKGYLYAAYFEVDAKDASHRLMTTQFPDASAELRRLVKSGTGTTTTTAKPAASTTTTTAKAPASTTTTSTTVPPPPPPDDGDGDGDEGYIPDGWMDWDSGWLPTAGEVTHDLGHVVEDDTSLVTPTTTALKAPVLPTTTTIKLPVTTTTVKLPVTTTTIKLPVTTTTVRPPSLDTVTGTVTGTVDDTLDGATSSVDSLLGL